MIETIPDPIAIGVATGDNGGVGDRIINYRNYLDDGGRLEGQGSTKIIALIPSVRNLTDSKLGVDLYRGLALLERYRGSLLQGIWHKAEEK
ncbi:hypothetical protein GW17_00056325 [Ensete ventricosum]|uniref:Uncharacterized protein n=1 Tax=Ensete ventricosum TaxID=4639 RepID=A0A444C8H5_ENSVE|nr:hypothetical protein GW17_00056325 [Ensete ventricosum]RZR71562.1 hypothetical protein BHM03_00005798 [Ensete ventricosum]